MTHFLSLQVPGVPPSLNHSYKQVWRVSRTGKRWHGPAKTEEANLWQNLVQMYVAKATPNEAIRKCKRFLICLNFQTPDAQRPDLDNMEKLTIDAVAKECGFNDKKVIAKASVVSPGFPSITYVDVLEAPPVEGEWLRRIIAASTATSRNQT